MATLHYREACEILAEEPYDEANARMGRFVRVRFDGEQDTRRITLSRELHGQAPIGSRGVLVLSEVLRPKGFQRRDGSIGSVMVEKRQVVGFEDVSPAEGRKAA